jgi:S-formylglutathione hydrolase
MEKASVRHRFPLVFGASALLPGGCRRVHQTAPDQPRLAAGVAVEDVTFHSGALQREMTYRVFLPAKIVAGREMPVVYLPHGRGDSFRAWSNHSEVAGYAVRGAILVMPDGGSSYYMNAAGKPKDRYEDYLANDLIADVESRFPAAKGRENRAIVGISMGGFAAAKLALTRPESFVFAGALSPAIDAPSRRFSWRCWEESLLFRSIFGATGSESRRKSDPFVLVESADPAKTPYLYLTAGEQEVLLGANRRFAAQLKQRRFSYEFHIKPGGHDWKQWNTQIPGCFESLFQHLKPGS